MTGETYRAADATGTMPPKVPGRHRWIATALFTVTGEAAAAAHAGSPGAGRLGPDNLVDIQVGCLDCEEAYADVSDRPCPAEAWTGLDAG